MKKPKGLRTIGFIGVGLMGFGMSKNMLEKGYPVTVIAHRNRKPVEALVRLGAKEVKTPAQVAWASQIVFICVSGSPQVEEVVHGKGGLMEGARPGLIIVDCSTSAPASTMKLAEEFRARGATFIDAPLARTPKEALEGRLNIMVGADKKTFDSVEPVLRAFCENIFHVGGVGSGHILKLINNFMAMSCAAVVAEAFTVGEKAGIDLNALYKLVSAGGVNSGIFQMIFPAALQGKFDQFRFVIANGRKDLRYYTNMVESLGMPSFIGQTMHQTFMQASALGYDDRFIPSLIEAQRRIAGGSGRAKTKSVAAKPKRAAKRG